jgi:hypothetical protein
MECVLLGCNTVVWYVANKVTQNTTNKVLTIETSNILLCIRGEKKNSSFRTVRLLFSVFLVTPAQFTSVGGNTKCHEYLVGFV